MKIVYDSKDEKNKFIYMAAKIYIMMRERIKNNPDFLDIIEFKMLDLLNEVAVAGTYPESFTDEEYKIIRELLYNTKR